MSTIKSSSEQTYPLSNNTNGVPVISLIVAVSENLAIGRKGQMPWHISQDMKYFKKITSGGIIIMGRKTWESLGCKALPDRRNIIVSRNLKIEDLCKENIPDNCHINNNSCVGIEVAKSLDEAINAAAEAKEIFIIGGGEIYKQAINIANRIYLTKVYTTVDDAETFFPVIDEGIWKEISCSDRFTDEKSGYDFEFKIYEKHSSNFIRKRQFQ
jgi:dihydrofolate reductase